MTPTEQLAATMFPSMASPVAATSPAATPAPTSSLLGGGQAADPPRELTPSEAQEQRLAKAMYPEPAEPVPPSTPDHIKALRSAEPGAGLYEYGAGLLPEFERSVEAVDVPEEIKTAAAKEWRAIAADHGLAPNDASTVMAEVRTFQAQPPTPERAAQLQTECRTMLRERYGDKGNEMLELGRKLVARDPRVHDLLARTGAGNSPRILGLVIEKAIAERARGRLK